MIAGTPYFLNKDDSVENKENVACMRVEKQADQEKKNKGVWERRFHKFANWA